VLARLHSKEEEGAEHTIGGVGTGGWASAANVAGQERKEVSQELGSDGFLPVGRRVSVGEHF
jgi:hypothetical protein